MRWRNIASPRTIIHRQLDLKPLLNRKRPFHQRLLWRLSRLIPLDGVTLSAPLILLGAIKAVGSLVAWLGGLSMVALVLVAAALGCLVRQFSHLQAPMVRTPCRVVTSRRRG